SSSAETAERQSPEHQLNVRSLWDMTEDLSLDTTLYYVSSLPAFHVADYWRLDMRLGWRISDQLRFSLVGQNLLDNAHREFSSASSLNATEVNRSLYGQFTWHF